MHGNCAKGDVLPLNTVFISRNHANRNNSDVYVYNGLLWDDYPNIDLNHTRDYLHFLGKASWKIKNLSGAAQIAVKAKCKLQVLGGERWKLYNLKRKPFYSLHPNLIYHGLINNIEKIKIMQHSKGLLFPVLWDEPFGLAIIESLYAGCPVFGTKNGSLPELINDKVGFVSNNPDEIIQAIKTKKFSPKVCHDYAVQNFSAKAMTANYLKLYDKILKGETLNKIHPYAK
jgi:glycosyltransferase involved in cell wall biosynthesis